MNIVLIGAPASGKGTQAKWLAKEFDLLHISTGELIREVIHQGGALSSKLAEIVQNGNLVPDDVIFEILKNFINSHSTKNGILFDGFPRTLNQAKMLSKIVSVDLAVEIDISLDTVLERVENRYSCANCGAGYIMSVHKSEFCSKCGSKLTKRADDTKEVATNRYNDYLLTKNNIVDYYKKLNKHHLIDGEDTAENVFNKICEVVRSII